MLKEHSDSSSIRHACPIRRYEGRDAIFSRFPPLGPLLASGGVSCFVAKEQFCDPRPRGAFAQLRREEE
jgi:hypothetical protein